MCINEKGGGEVNQFKNCIYSRIKRINEGKCQKLNISAFFGLLLGLMTAACAIGINIDKNMVYMVKVNNSSIGYVKNIETYKNAIEAIEKTDGTEPVKSITAEKVRNDSKKYITSDTIEKTAREKLNLKMQAVAMYVGDIEIAKVQSRDEADKVLEMVRQYYYPKEGSYKILKDSIKETVAMKDMMVSPAEIADVNDVVQKIVDGRGIKKTYTIKKGDTLWDIALKNNMSIEDIQGVNPNINIDKLKLNQVINLALSVPYLNVEIVADVTTKQVVPYDSTNVVDKSLAKGSKKVKQSGKNGLSQVEEKVTMLNGDVIEENVVKSTVITAAVDEVVAVGSKVSTYVASGRFIRPSRGIITSRFGRRSRGDYHTGVDFASSVGTKIVAADSGTVSFVGWNGGYGRCLMINHGNGYQTLYGHTSRIYVKQGQSVKKGQVIAAVGSTGNSTGPHVHFEVRLNGASQNPLKYVK